MTESARMRILIAEDEPLVAEGLRARLEGLGHEVVGVACDGGSAVARAEALSPDLIFLDVKMPRMDGLDATERIMANTPAAIILLTGHADPALLDRAMIAGVMGYLVKPVEAKALCPAISLATTRFAELMELRQDVRSLTEALAVRQQVERAKGILVQRLGRSPAKAHASLRQYASREGCTLVQAAGRVVVAEKFFAELEQTP
jgi:response regulator NasT